MRNESEKLFQRAKEVMPGGVNSPVRAFRSVGMEPVFISHANGSKIFDRDSNEYIDYVCSWGPMILGHNNPRIAKRVKETIDSGLSFGAPTEMEVLLAEKIIKLVPDIQMVRMVSSGTEAVMSAIRLARGFTGKSKIIKFEGCYHGHSDSMLVKAGSGALTTGVPDSLGVTRGASEDTLTCIYNDCESVENMFKQNRGEIAAVIVEPVAANMGVVLPQNNFLSNLRKLCDKYNALLIFDEVITGFRLALGGAQEYFGVKADLVTFGKIIGGGMPVGAYAGNKEIMECISPLGGVYQAGTLSGNPISMAAGFEQLSILEETKDLYKSLEDKTNYLAKGFEEVSKDFGVRVTINKIGSLLCAYFTEKEVLDFNSAKQSDILLYSKYFKGMFDLKINLAPSQFEAMFVSLSHTKEDLDNTIKCARETFSKLK